MRLPFLIETPESWLDLFCDVVRRHACIHDLQSYSRWGFRFWSRHLSPDLIHSVMCSPQHIKEHTMSVLLTYPYDWMMVRSYTSMGQGDILLTYPYDWMMVRSYTSMGQGDILLTPYDWMMVRSYTSMDKWDILLTYPYDWMMVRSYTSMDKWDILLTYPYDWMMVRSYTSMDKGDILLTKTMSAESANWTARHILINRRINYLYVITMLFAHVCNS